MNFSYHFLSRDRLLLGVRLGREDGEELLLLELDRLPELLLRDGVERVDEDLPDDEGDRLDDDRLEDVLLGVEDERIRLAASCIACRLLLLLVAELPSRLVRLGAGFV